MEAVPARGGGRCLGRRRQYWRGEPFWNLQFGSQEKDCGFGELGRCDGNEEERIVDSDVVNWTENVTSRGLSILALQEQAHTKWSLEIGLPRFVEVLAIYCWVPYGCDSVRQSWCEIPSHDRK